MAYSAGWNRPGYLPDVDPATFDREIDAIDFVWSELSFVMESDYSNADRARVDQRYEDLENVGETHHAGYVYWVTEID